ncbi:MAG: RagB/SusD family nutrient uptake outer membrane protein [Bacteroidales bacterium]|nr:RagB/SusD family nutrient uptake outer membrane protein [Bacteroidales bacterium]
MKYTKYILLLASLMLCSCESLYKPKNVGEVQDEDMWVVPEMAQGVLMNAYQAQPNRPNSFNSNYLDAATDNAVTNSFEDPIYRLSMGDISSTNSPLSCWSEAYQQFQNIHLFINKGLGEKTRYSISDVDSDNAFKRRLFAEAHYLRAWWGARLLQYYGGRTSDGQALGYPIVTSFQTTDDAADFSNIKRDTYEDCVAQICADLDLALDPQYGLPTIPASDYLGRATTYMAEFLKARVLFLAANPAYQPASIVRINGMGDFTVVDETAYKAKWDRAIDQLWKVMQVTGQTTFVALKRTDLVDMDQNNPVTPAHFIFRYYFQTNGVETNMFPPFYYGSANTQPSQNLVNAYPMKANGYPITDALSAYDDQNPYAGRDDRLALTIYRQGDKFGLNDSYIDVVYGGKDSESFMNGGSRASRTGYYVHKGLSEKADMLVPTQKVSGLHFFPTMRMAEIFLDLAEALNESVGPTGTYSGVTMTAYDIIKDIRKKAGGIVTDSYIESVKGSKDSFRELILNERRLEFAFENFRYWDLRRRLLPLNEGIKGITVTRDAGGVLHYAEKDVEARDFNELKFYYLPLPYAEVKKNPNLIQNMDY